VKRVPVHQVAGMLAIVFCLVVSAQAAPQAVPTPPIVPTSGAGFQTLAAFTLPPTFYVGDHVELRIRLKVNDTNLRAPATMPSDQWIQIDSISITHAKDYSVLHIFFVSFAPGQRAIPEINLGGIILRGIKITATSLASEGRTRLTDPKGQIALPGTTLILGIAVALLIGIPLAFVLLFRRFRYALAAFVEKRRARRPWRQLSRALDALASERPPLNSRRFYITLADELRRYLSQKFGTDFRSVTAREFKTAARTASVEAGAAEGLSAVMSFGELVKFAGTQAGDDVLRSDLARVREIVEGIEETAERELRARQLQERAAGRTVSGVGGTAASGMTRGDEEQGR